MAYSYSDGTRGYEYDSRYFEIEEESDSDRIETLEQLAEYINSTDFSETIDAFKEIVEFVAPKCPQCGEALIFEGGCNICKSCGYSKCD